MLMETPVVNAPSVQAPRAVVMIRPHRFQPNPETAADNTFQTQQGHAEAGSHDLAEIAARAREEVTEAAATLEATGVKTHVFEDYGDHETPDSVFPNNWFSTHPGGHVALYPMAAPNRRRERRADIVEMLKRMYRVQDVIDYSGLEQDGLYLEGTGAMVLDHIVRIAYAARSRRADPVVLERFCTHFNFEPLMFDATDSSGKAVYHTNVMMSVATEFALIGLDLIRNSVRRDEIRHRLEESGRTVIALDTGQISEFAANALELTGDGGRLLAISQRGLNALSSQQRRTIERSARLVPLNVPSIELAGGSVRCMLAGIHLARR